MQRLSIVLVKILIIRLSISRIDRPAFRVLSLTSHLRNFSFVKDEPLLKENVKRWILENQADTQMLENDKVEEFFQELGFRYL